MGYGQERDPLGEYLAHSINRNRVGHRLITHLDAVGELAGGLAEPFGGGPAAHAAGKVHDLGKFADDSQAYLAAHSAGRGPARGPDHKTAGALVMAERLRLGPLAMVVQGHHGGLRSPEEFRAWLKQHRDLPQVTQALTRTAGLIDQLASAGPIQLPSFVNDSTTAAELFVRMVFSALVDADFLDTERHFHGVTPRSRDAYDLAELWRRFEADQAALSGHASDTVSRLRHEVYQACRAAAAWPPGMYRFTAPTGIGKTRSVLAFALPHALRHRQRRVIVAVPYVSITEQTAATYRAIFEHGTSGQPVVLEHHHAASTLRPDTDEQEHSKGWARLAAENWDAPIVVTTVVELLESIFAHRPARMRKLHRLAGSVLILDEVQSLPVRLLEPILDVLGELVRNYHTTVVLTTATQPAFEVIPAFAAAAPRELVPSPARLFQALRRVRYEHLDELRPQSWERIAELVVQAPQVMVVVNSRADALALGAALNTIGLPEDQPPLHLSTLLCGAHRLQVLGEVATRLSGRRPCRLIATSVVEAGVDLDFPLVMRAVGPLYSIVQVAGRCNRSGTLDWGRVIIFQPAAERLPKGYYRLATHKARQVLQRLRGTRQDIDDPAVLHAYFREVLSLVDPDAVDIQRLRGNLDYPSVAESFQLIEPTASILVPWGNDYARAQATQALTALQAQTSPPRQALRQVQPFLVSVREPTAQQLQRTGQIHQLTGDLYSWTGRNDAYDPIWGLTPAITPEGSGSSELP